MIVNPNYPGAESEMAEVEAAGPVIGTNPESASRRRIRARNGIRDH
jgi:hypothetical protein